ncbi:GNAT family N-acetyltransferase [Paenibacillus sp. UNC451MF]|uniref:GNAT family N-acetyltransferase n=1 Tax=Paenibacillus sp. UNC451MF TaxID=1449063 RepID=UPI00068C9C6A|nr:GNAT family N-acetyltransferase [Paenibacillus sp. UNC451MF]
MDEVVIKKVNRLDTLELSLLVNESTNEGFRHLQRLVNDYESARNTFDKQGEAIFIAYHQGKVVGVCGLNQDPYAKENKVGRVRRMYVSSGSRRLGIGRLLMDAVISEARRHYSLLVLKTDNPGADLFYRSLGFVADTPSAHYSHVLTLKGSDHIWKIFEEKPRYKI